MERLKRLQIDGISTINLTFAGLFHFLVDFFPISTFYFYLVSDTDNFFITVLTYNVLAFGLQPFIGFLIDKKENIKHYFCVSSILLVLLGAFIPPIISIINAILLGLGNAIFHVSFSKDVLKESKSSFPLGVFIAPGVLGLGIGLTFLNDIIRITLGVVMFVLLILYVAFIYVFKKKIEFCGEKYTKFDFSKYKTKANLIFILMIALVILSVFLRGALGKLTPNFEIVNYFLIVSLVSFSAKIIGGLFNKKICLSISFLMCFLSAFFINDLTGTIFFVLSINLLMPLTLDYLRKLLPNLEATSLGISAFFLLVPVIFFTEVTDSVRNIFLIVFIVLHLLILLLLFGFEVIEKKINQKDKS